MNTKLKIIAGILTATLATTASANLVTEWEYVNQAGFESYTGSTDTTTTNDDVVATGNSAGTGTNILVSADAPLATDLTWGTPAAGTGSGDPQSSMNIDSPVDGTMTTNDSSWAPGTAITHENWVIVGDSLTQASVLDGLALVPTAWVGQGDDAAYDALLTDSQPYFAPQLEFGINFFETPNGGVDVNGNCPNGEPNFIGDNVNGCGDVFEITGLDALGITPIVGDDYIEFSVPFVLQNEFGPIPGWQDVEYFVTTRLSGLTTLPAGYECSNGESGCFGFVTVEQESNVLDAGFKIHTVPEPTGIALFGLGLLITGLTRRKMS